MGAKTFVSNLGDDESNASNIEIAHFNIYDLRNLENFDNTTNDIF